MVVVNGHVRVKGGSEAVKIDEVSSVTRYVRKKKDGSGSSYTYGIKGIGTFNGKERNLAAFVVKDVAKKVAEDNGLKIKDQQVKSAGPRRSCEDKCKESCEKRAAKSKARKSLVSTKKSSKSKSKGSTSTSKKIEEAAEAVKEASSSLREASQTLKSLEKSKSKSKAKPKSKGRSKKSK